MVLPDGIREFPRKSVNDPPVPFVISTTQIVWLTFVLMSGSGASFRRLHAHACATKLGVAHRCGLDWPLEEA
jgi:hypothetical protein